MNSINELLVKFLNTYDFNEFKHYIKEYIDIYMEKGPRIINTENIKENYLEYSLDIDADSNNKDNTKIIDEYNNSEDLNEFVDEMANMLENFSNSNEHIEFEKYIIDLRKISYYDKPDIINNYLNIVSDGGIISSAIFDLVDDVISIDIVENSKKRIWNLKFKAGSYEACIMIRDILINERSKARNKKLDDLIQGKRQKTKIENIDVKSIVGLAKIESLNCLSSDYLYLNSFSDFFHWNESNGEIHNFYIHELSSKTYVADISYLEENGLLHIELLNFHDTIYLENIILPFEKKEDVRTLLRIIEYLDKYRDNNIYKKRTKEKPNELSEFIN